MTDLSEYNSYGEKLESHFCLRTSPMAVKMLESEGDIPEGAIRPSTDMGTRIAQCQAFALSRREKKSVAMLKEDNNCFAPIIAYGIEDKPDDAQYELFMRFPTFDKGKYIGIVSAPLRTANFEPDVISQNLVAFVRHGWASRGAANSGPELFANKYFILLYSPHAKNAHDNSGKTPE